MNLFGFEIKRRDEQPPTISFAPKQKDDGAVVIPGGGTYGIHLDIDGAIRTETELVSKYREMAEHPELDRAIDDIVNEAIVGDGETEPIKIVLDDVDQPERIKKLINDEFKEIQKLLEFNEHSYDIFERWYVDGRLYYHVIIDEKKLSDGIKELRYVDPRKIRKVREQNKKKTNAGVPIVIDGDEYYIYNDRGFAKQPGMASATAGSFGGVREGVRIAKDAICFITSGRTNTNRDAVLSHLHKAIKPLNQLRTMEDSLVIYRISRAPERRIFYIDVGGLPRQQAEQYVADMRQKFKNQTVYDQQTGAIRDRRKYMTMLEDFWLPRREGGKGTEISNLPGGQNLGQIEDIVYFQRKLYKSLNVPSTRLEPETVYNLGRGTEITRDELKFNKFVERLRMRFSQLFTKLLEKQLVLKGVITQEEWEDLARDIRYEYAKDNYQAELKEQEIMRERVNMLREVSEYVGPGTQGYYSKQFVRRHILRLSEEEIDEMEKEIEEEKQAGEYDDPEAINDEERPDPGPPLDDSPPQTSEE